MLTPQQQLEALPDDIINPWCNPAVMAYKYSPRDVEIISRVNEMYHNNDHPLHVNLSYLPEPFVGNKDAEIYLLMGNPGRFKRNEANMVAQVMEDQNFREAVSRNLTHSYANGNGESVEYPFYYLNPMFQAYDDGWWDQCLSPLINDFAVTPQQLSNKIFAVELYGYHTERLNSSFLSVRNRLPSIAYTEWLIRQAIIEGKIILLGRRVKE